MTHMTKGTKLSSFFIFYALESFAEGAVAWRSAQKLQVVIADQRIDATPS